MPNRSNPQVPARLDHVDGLRAVAVLLVIFYHAHAFGLDNGFVGVDIFFVISGYLIGGLIISRGERGTWSSAYYASKRLLRVAPALLAVLVASAAAAYLVMPPGDFNRFAKDLPSALFFYSNHAFADGFDYFAAPSEMNPLIHTWSLSIEAQLYVIFGLLGTVYRRRWFILAVAGMTAASFFYFIRSPLEEVYFSLPARLWEFALGSLVAYIHTFHAPRSGKLTDPVVALVVAAFAYVVVVSGPGERQLVIVAGTVTAALVLLLPAPGSIFRRALGIAPLAWLGLISYSAYLIHQPMFAFWRHWSITTPTATEYAVLIALTLVAAAVSFRWVERPFLQRRGLTWRPALAAAGTAAALVAFGDTIENSQGAPERYDVASLDDIQYADRDKSQNVLKCRPLTGTRYAPLTKLEGADTCIIGADGEPTIAVWGDSHADMYGASLDALLRSEGRSALFVRLGACPPIVGIVRVDGTDRCRPFNQTVFETIIASKAIDTVVVAGRYAYYLHGPYDNGEGGQEYGRSLLVDVIDRPAGISRVPAVLDAMRATFYGISEAGKKLVLLYPVPAVGLPVPQTLMKTTLRGQVFDHSYDNFLNRQAGVHDVLNTVADDVLRIRPAPLLCDRHSRRCQVWRDGKVLYHDSSHLTVTGADLVVAAYADEIRAALHPARGHLVIDQDSPGAAGHPVKASSGPSRSRLK